MPAAPIPCFPEALSLRRSANLRLFRTSLFFASKIVIMSILEDLGRTWDAIVVNTTKQRYSELGYS